MVHILERNSLVVYNAEEKRRSRDRNKCTRRRKVEIKDKMKGIKKKKKKRDKTAALKVNKKKTKSIPLLPKYEKSDPFTTILNF